MPRRGFKMKKFYQTEWLKIPFSSFANLSSKTLPGPEFYNAFYRAVFKKYQSYESLDADWRQKKSDLVDWLAEQFHDGAQVLSVGCGLGYMESRLWQLHKDRIDLHVQDYATDAHLWLEHVMPEDHIHAPGERQDSFLEYDYIYLCAVDYAMANLELIALLNEYINVCKKNGQIILISGSFLDETKEKRITRSLKEIVKDVLDRFGARKRGQFWGWKRTRTEYRNLMQAVGLTSITDGFFRTPQQKRYWIKGIKD